MEPIVLEEPIEPIVPEELIEPIVLEEPIVPYHTQYLHNTCKHIETI